MKKALFFLLILTLTLLAACGREAKEPVPAWPDRITGEYDSALTFTYRGTEPESAGVDSLTGRMTALFPLEDGNTLALGWRRLAGAEVELLEDFLAGGGVAGIWAEDNSEPGTAEAYVCLRRQWFCLSASCPEKDPAALLKLLDGTVSAASGEERVCPRLTGENWVEELPWEEDWTCFTVAWYELEPESGKEALRDFLTSRSWVLTEPDVQNQEYLASRSQALFTIHTRSGEKVWFSVMNFGDIYWKGAYWHSVETEDAFFAAYREFAQTGVNMDGGPVLTYGCGEDALTGIAAAEGTWYHITRAGERSSMSFDAAAYNTVDWLDGTHPVLAAAGEVFLSFPGREPDSLSLSAFTPLGDAPVVLNGLSFAPYAGINAYALRARWEEREQGGYGSAVYILLVDGACPAELPESEAEAGASLLEADPYGCSFTLENRGEQQFALYPAPLFRKTDFGGWEWVKPLWIPEDEPLVCGAGKISRLGFDWSRDLGTQEPGEYALLLYGKFLDRKSRPTGDTVYLPLRFTLDENAVPDAPGPLTAAELPEGVSVEMTQLSLHRWIQSIKVQTEGRFIPDRDFSLFRKEEDGTLTPILPRYHLPHVLNYPTTFSSRSGVILDVDLACQYGVLQPGAYVVRRRLFRLEEGEEHFNLDSPFDRSWRTFPAERILYLDAELYISGYLNAPLDAPMREVEPNCRPYGGEDLEVPVAIQNSRFTAGECRFAVKNLGKETIGFGQDEDTLFYLDRNGEWLPVAKQRHLASGLLAVEIRPGESGEWRTDFGLDRKYARLPKGTYRMVFPVRVGGQSSGEPYTTGLLVVEFAIREDGTGMYSGVFQEVTAVVKAYRSSLAEAYVLPEKPEDIPEYLYGNLINHDDPYVRQWEVEKHQGSVRVTVYRDRDVERAKALLADFPYVEVVRGKNAAQRVSPVTESNSGTLGTLRAECLEQSDPELYQEGTWLLTLEIEKEDVRLHPNWLMDLFPEVWDREEERWIPLTQEHWNIAPVYYAPVFLERGTELNCVVSLGLFHAEFSPGEEYRFAAAVNEGDRESQIEYYTCPFAVTEAGQA